MKRLNTPIIILTLICAFFGAIGISRYGWNPFAWPSKSDLRDLQDYHSGDYQYAPNDHRQAKAFICFSQSQYDTCNTHDWQTSHTAHIIANLEEATRHAYKYLDAKDLLVFCNHFGVEKECLGGTIIVNPLHPAMYYP